MTAAADILTSLTAEARQAPESGIVEVMNYGRTRPGMIPLWTGEGDLPTPAFISEAATRALVAGETYYTWQRGIPELRAAIARYNGRLYGGAFTADQFFVTGSGMQSIQIAATMFTSAGDEAIIPTPAWPNAAAAVGIRGAKPVCVPMRTGNGGWLLDMDDIAAAVTPRTKLLFLNSPSNPSGWCATHDDLRNVLALSRKHGFWIVADEIYARFWYGEGLRAPSFHDVMAPDDRILFVNTMSKNWAMTGWRMGWIELPEAHVPALGQVVENMIQYSTSGVPQFLQKGAIAALDRGDDFLDHMIDRARRGRDIMCRALEQTGRCRFSRPDGAFYLFFTVDGVSDTRPFALKIVDEANVGLAPGSAFGPGGESWLRLCYLRSPEALQTAGERLVDWFRRAG
jgi:aspartate/methionine/tyrosine aminotransferase